MRPTTPLRTAACLAAAAPAALAAQVEECHPYQEPKLTASDPAAGDRFGIAVSVHGDVAVSGAYLKAVSGPSSGAAYVFERDAAGAWLETAKLAASDGASGDWFGVSVATDAERVLVGAQLHDAGANDSGAAYVYRLEGGSWVEEAKLVPPLPAASEWLGHSVSIAGDVAVAGAHLTDGAATDSGAVHVFRHSPGGWFHEIALEPSDPEAASEFGSSVGTDGISIVVGARWKDDAGTNSGAAYVFRNVHGVWIQEAKLAPAGLAANDELGFEVAVHGDRAVVGARLDDDAGTNAGALYVFARDAASGTWSEEAKLVPADLAADDRLGEAVSIDGDLVIGGARQHDAAGSDGGAAYVFARDASGTWKEAAKLVGSDVGPMHFFGIAADVQDGRAIVGANLDPEHGSQAGAAYVYELHCAAPGEEWQPVAGGGGVGGSLGIPSLAGVGALVAPGTIAFVADGAAPLATSVLVLGASRIDVPLFGGTLVPNPDVLVTTTTDGNGALQLLLPLQGSIPSGLQAWAQLWVLDATAPQLAAASDAVEQTAP